MSCVKIVFQHAAAVTLQCPGRDPGYTEKNGCVDINGACIITVIDLAEDNNMVYQKLLELQRTKQHEIICSFFTVEPCDQDKDVNNQE